MFSTPNLIKLIITLGVPLFLFATKNHRGMLIWIGLTLGTEVFNVQVGASLTPLNVIGLLYLPVVFFTQSLVTETRPAKLLLLSVLLLGLLGFVYGYILPWPDLTGVRPFTQRAEGRSIIYFVGTLANVSIAFYIARLMRNEINVGSLLRYLLLGTSIAALGVLVEWRTGTDLFSLFSPGARAWNPEVFGRVRGLNGEPRTSAQAIAWGILLLANLRGLGPWRIILLIIHIAALLVTISTAGVTILAVGLVLTVWFSSNSVPRRIVLSGAILVTAFALLQLYGPDLFDSWQTNLERRLLSSGSYNEASGPGELLANRLEVFDASAVLFLWDNPVHFVTGTGPGLISLPASRYIPADARLIYGNRIDSIPHTGLIQIMANMGVIGIVLWFGVFLSCRRALKRKSEGQGARSEVWHEALSLFSIFGVLYLFQAKPIWYLFLGIGLAAAILQEQSAGVRRSVLVQSPITRTRGRSL